MLILVVDVRGFLSACSCLTLHPNLLLKSQPRSGGVAHSRSQSHAEPARRGFAVGSRFRFFCCFVAMQFTSLRYIERRTHIVY